MPFERPVLSADRIDAKGRIQAGRSALALMPVVLSIHEQRFLEAHREARRAAGSPDLAWLPPLTRVARGRCDQMPVFGPTHVTPTGERSYLPLLEALGVAFSAAGENIAAMPGFGNAEEDVKRIMAMMLDHPGQRRNLLDPGYTGMGVGVVASADELFWTAIFVQT